ncbi:MAG: phytanoyl-CoA dioxygenase family protein [Ferrovibrio sp.]|uniref:phytanoyl-CoA dioxygenase family protein n=1 Tax=Ferrovibrio sp. TaxID=1917215 RepID=UPI00262FE34D|nr:phytanoyl-CoA dioxygenase family protein [Ferrovibrio sp.]MCW0235376.1 phytanoyl-CoA dioxygenase family protein [Ferrovibrio sp.]
MSAFSAARSADQPELDHNWEVRLPEPEVLRTAYARDGYAIVRGLFSPAEVVVMAGAFDRLQAAGLALGRSFRHGNLLFRLGDDPHLGRILRMVQWPSWRDAALDRVRLDLRFAAVLQPLIGDSLKQIINQMHWKPPGAARVEFAYHQDSRFRRPATAFRDLAGSYVQTGIAIDPHTRASGAMKVIPGSHWLGDLGLGGDGPILQQSMQDAALMAAGLDPAAAVDLELAPGDLALWSPYLVHGSGINTTAADRRLYINGYVRAENCDRGEWAFRAGRPQRLGAEPVLVHYEALHERPEPHFIDD